MRSCVGICVCVCLREDTGVREKLSMCVVVVYVRACMHACVRACVCACVFVCACACAFICACVRACMIVCIYVVCVCVCVQKGRSRPAAA